MNSYLPNNEMAGDWMNSYLPNNEMAGDIEHLSYDEY